MVSDTNEDGPSPDTELSKELSGLNLPQTPLLSVAVWGWQGDGKTTSLLTAVHYTDPFKTLLGFSLVREHDEISEIAERPEFKDFPLLHLAKASKTKIEEMQSRFIDDCEWPDGTDTPDAYVLRVEDAASTRAFAVISDLPGGSYSENDRVAEGVIKNAHAIIVMVSPRRWLGQDLRARAYQDMVRYRIRRCTELAVPVSVLIAQADRDREAAEQVYEELTDAVSHLDSGGGCRLFQVSVIADPPFEQSSSDGDEPPRLLPGAERNPRLLGEAWVWTLVKALGRQVTSPTTRVPVIELERAARAPENEPASLLELRQVGDFSDIPGTMLCPSEGSGGDSVFLVVTHEGTLVEVELDSDGRVPKLSNLGSLEDAADLVPASPTADPSAEGGEPSSEVETVADLRAGVFNGELTVGPRTSPEFIWSGHLHDLVRPLALPTALVAWHPITAGLVGGLDSTGRLHLLEKKTDQWRQLEFIPDFVPGPSDGAFCVYLPGSRVIIAGDGTDTAAVLVDSTGWGDRVAPPFSLAYSEEFPVVSSIAGSIAYVGADYELRLSVGGSDLEVGPVHPHAGAYCALGNAIPGLIAWVDPDLRLRVARVTEDRVRSSDDQLSPQLPRLPLAMQWASGDNLMAVDLGHRTWQSYVVRGL